MDIKYNAHFLCRYTLYYKFVGQWFNSMINFGLTVGCKKCKLRLVKPVDVAMNSNLNKDMYRSHKRIIMS